MENEVKAECQYCGSEIFRNVRWNGRKAWETKGGGSYCYKRPGRGHVHMPAREAKSMERTTITDGQGRKVEVSECPNCGQWQTPADTGDCLNECKRRGFVTLVQNKRVTD